MDHTDAVAHLLYSLSQQTDDLRNAILSEPHALDTLVQVVQSDHARSGAKTKPHGKQKWNGAAAEEEEDRLLFLRLLISGELFILYCGGLSNAENRCRAKHYRVWTIRR